MQDKNYRVMGTAGSNAIGSATLHFDLLVASNGAVSGHAEITQSIPPPNGDIRFPVTGTVRTVTLPPLNHLVALTGTYAVSFPPPAIGEILEHFNAHFAVDAKWNGRGGFTYGGHDVNDVPVKSELLPG